MGQTEPIRVVLVDDHEMIRVGISSYLRTRSGRFEVVGEASDGLHAIELCRSSRPDVVLMDLMMPRMNGLEATRAIAERWPEIKVVIMTGFNDSFLPDEVLRAGAVGYIAKTIEVEQIDSAIVDARDGKLVLDEQTSQELIQAIQSPEPELSDREFETLELLCEGLTNREIAKTLQIAPSTVKTHVSNVLKKLNASNRATAIAIARERRLLSKWRSMRESRKRSEKKEK